MSCSETISDSCSESLSDGDSEFKPDKESLSDSTEDSYKDSAKFQWKHPVCAKEYSKDGEIDEETQGEIRQAIKCDIKQDFETGNESLSDSVGDSAYQQKHLGCAEEYSEESEIDQDIQCQMEQAVECEIKQGSDIWSESVSDSDSDFKPRKEMLSDSTKDSVKKLQQRHSSHVEDYSEECEMNQDIECEMKQGVEFEMKQDIESDHETDSSEDLSPAPPKKTFRCNYKGCSKTYSQKYHLRRHVKAVHEKKPDTYYCPQCSVPLASLPNLYRHVKRWHERPLPTCEYCKKIFKKHTSLKAHLYSHTNIKQFICDVNGCGKRFVNITYLNKHKKFHNKYICKHEGCEKILPNWTTLRKHIMEEHPPQFSCTQCKKTFNTRAKLKHHTFVHDPDNKPFSCPYEECTKSYTLKRNLRLHIEAIHLHTVHRCTYEGCERTFNRGLLLKRHLEKHYPPKEKPKKTPKPRKPRKDKGVRKNKAMVSSLTGLVLEKDINDILCADFKLILDKDNLKNIVEKDSRFSKVIDYGSDESDSDLLSPNTGTLSSIKNPSSSSQCTAGRPDSLSDMNCKFLRKPISSNKTRCRQSHDDSSDERLRNMDCLIAKITQFLDIDCSSASESDVEINTEQHAEGPGELVDSSYPNPDHSIVDVSNPATKPNRKKRRTSSNSQALKENLTSIPYSGSKASRRRRINYVNSQSEVTKHEGVKPVSSNSKRSRNKKFKAKQPLTNVSASEENASRNSRIKRKRAVGLNSNLSNLKEDKDSSLDRSEKRRRTKSHFDSKVSEDPPLDQDGISDIMSTDVDTISSERFASSERLSQLKRDLLGMKLDLHLCVNALNPKVDLVRLTLPTTIEQPNHIQKVLSRYASTYTSLIESDSAVPSSNNISLKDVTGYQSSSESEKEK